MAGDLPREVGKEEERKKKKRGGGRVIEKRIDKRVVHKAKLFPWLKGEFKILRHAAHRHRLVVAGVSGLGRGLCGASADRKHLFFRRFSRATKLATGFSGARTLGINRGHRGVAEMSQGAMGGRGAFILFEGADRCGKSTQCKLLVDGLNSRGVEAELWRYPDRTTAIGKMIDGYLQSQTDMDDACVHLLFSANRWEKRKLMLEKLASGVTLVIDRYGHSGTAFTAAKKQPGLDLEWCKSTDAGLPAPDALIYLEMPVEETLKRDGFGGERYEKTEFQREVVKNYELLRRDAWKCLDASRTIEDLHADALKIAMGAVEECRTGKPIGTLWED